MLIDNRPTPPARVESKKTRRSNERGLLNRSTIEWRRSAAVDPSRRHVDRDKCLQRTSNTSNTFVDIEISTILSEVSSRIRRRRSDTTHNFTVEIDKRQQKQCHG